MSFDALDIEIFRYASSSIVDEIETNLSRTAYSPLIYEYKDYCVGLLTADFRLLTQSQGSLPIFLADLGPPVEDAVSVIGPENLQRGDVLLTNYARIGGQHLNNVVMARPLFADDAIIGYVAIRAHWADVGGLAPGSISWNARDIFQEGVQFRGLRVMRANALVPEVVATIEANTRLPEYVLGDLAAQLSGCQLGEERWVERVGNRWTASEIKELTSLQWDASERLARREIAAIPDGEYSAECRLDDEGIPGGDPLPLRVTVSVAGDEMTVDLTDLPPQTKTPMNAGLTGGAVSCARVAFKSLLVPDHPADDGLFRPLHLVAPEGRILTATGDAPMGHWNSALPTVIDLVLRAIGEAQPDRVPAGHHATMGVFILYGRREDGRWWQMIDTHAGGWGGSAEADGNGPLKTMMHGDNRDIPMEVCEARFPVRFLSHAFVPDSAGEGKHRGGFGTEKVLEVLEPTYLETSMDRTLDPPWGLAGGEAGRVGRIEIKTPQEPWVTANKVSGLLLPAGTLVRMRSSGGGGWGSRKDRAREDRDEDRLAGLVTK